MDRWSTWGFRGGYACGVGIGIALGTLVPDRKPAKVPEQVIAAAELVVGAKPVKLPFKPPQGRLRYAYEARIERDSGIQVVRSIDELSFRKGRGGRWSLRWVTRSFSADAPPAVAAVLTRPLRLAREQPLSISVSKTGAPVALLNEALLRSSLNGIVGRSVATGDFSAVPPEGRAAVRRVLAQVATEQRRQSSKDFTDTILENPRLLLRSFGTLTPGEARAGTADRPSRVDAGRIRYTTRTELSRYEPGKSAEIVVASIADTADARRTMAAMIAPVLAAIPDPRQREAARARIAEMGEPAISDVSVLVIDLPSGLARSLVWRQQFYMPGRGSTVETRTYKRLP